ncbi:MAG: thiol:disulfide interchange protein [candidate division TM6 bacterium GW2011_GWF2_32_72]|nr:MAG: thiol:disulfide interchange protein [candidate division TM6 bacterium GW2011_GWF2_32_72]
MIKRQKLSSLKLIYLSLLVCCTPSILNSQINIQTKQLDSNVTDITVFFKLEKDQNVYHDFLKFSSDNPYVKISDWKTSTPPKEQFDTSFKATKKIFDSNFSINLQATRIDNSVSTSNIHLSYYLNTEKSFKEKIITLSFNSNNQSNEISGDIEIQKTSASSENKQDENKEITWGDKISGWMKNANSLWLQILLALLLGFLLSLTPCVYPMIPITVGILQTQSSKSIFKNLIMALAYAIGLSTTFSILGLLAAFSGQIFGKILINPIFVIVLVIVLGYLGLSMYGFFDLYIPSFLRNSNGVKSGSGAITSAFIFGMLSGSVASPCLSPGLALLLTIVATIGSKFIGFALLFAFGFGLSIPLIIVGTFSSSMNALPQSGMWMIEVKKIFGILLLLMCFYYLNNILPYHIILWLLTGFFAVFGILYFRSIAPYDSKLIKTVKNLLGLAFIASAVWFGVKGYTETFLVIPENTKNIWLNNYDDALNLAKEQNKKLLLDFWFKACATCKNIDKNKIHQQDVLKTIETNFIPVKIDIFNSENDHIRKQFNVKGAPTFIILDPQTENEIIRVGDDFGKMTIPEIIKFLETNK